LSRYVLVLPLIVAALASCADGNDTDAPMCSHDPPLTYDDFGKPFMQQFCNGCHSSLVTEEYRNDAPLGVDFDTYQGVLENRIKIRVQTNPEGPIMPPGGGPNPDQYADLLEWLNCQVDPDGEALGIP